MKHVTSWRLGLLLVCFLGLIGCDLKDPTPPLNPQDAVYVCNQEGGTVSVIEPDSNEVVATVNLTDLGFSSNPKPHHVVVEPDGSAWYVSLIGDDVVAKFNAQNQLVETVDFEAPGMLALHPTADRLYAGHTMSLPDVPSTVAVIQRRDMRRLDVVSVPFSRPHGMKVHPNGRFAYSSSLSTNRIVAIDTESNQVQAPAVFSEVPRQRYVQFEISPDGQRMYVTGQVSGQVQVLSLEDPTTPVLRKSIDVGPEPWHPQLSDDGQTLYFGAKASNTVFAMDTETFEAEKIVGRGIAQPHGSALSPDGDYLYISNNNLNGTYTPSTGENIGTVVVIDTETREIHSVIEVGEKPAGINTRWQP